MGKLLSFLGGAAKSLANTLDQDRLEKKRIEDDERQFAKQVSWAKVAEAMRVNTKTKTAIPVETPDGGPIQDENGNWIQRTQIASGALLDDDLNVTRPPAMLPGRSIPTTDPNAPTQYQQAMLEQKQLDRDARIEAAKIRGSRGGGSGGSGAKDRFELRNIGGRVMRVNITTGEKEDMGPSAGEGSGGAGGMTEKGWREGMDQTLSSIQGADAGKLKSIIRQYGGDNQVLIPGANDKETEAGLREMAFAVAETYWNERKPSNKKASEPEPKKADSPPVAGATKAPDGNWYVQKDGKWFKVEA